MLACSRGFKCEHLSWLWKVKIVCHRRIYFIAHRKANSAPRRAGMTAYSVEETATLPGIQLCGDFKFREGQEEFLHKLVRELRAGRTNHMGVFVPGYGKTITALASFVIANALGIAQKLVVFVPRGNLRDQYADPEELHKVFQFFGTRGFSFCVADSDAVFLKNLNTQIIVTTYQYASGAKGNAALQKFCETAPCMFVMDEVHHLAEEGSWAVAIKQLECACSVSLSGTPLRSDNKLLFGVPFEVREDGNQYYVALHEVTLRDAHKEGKILKKIDVHIVDYAVTMKRNDTGEVVELTLGQMLEIAKSKSEFDAYLARKNLRFHEVYLRNLLAPAFQAFGQKRAAFAHQQSSPDSKVLGATAPQMLVIAMSNAHAAAMHEFIVRNFPTYSCARIGQDVPQKEREKLLKKYRQGSIDVMVQVDMIGEGTDIKPISLIVKSDLVRAWSKTLQQIFRGMRYYNGFSKENNVCDIFAANDSEVVKILEWISSEEQVGIEVKVKREHVDREIVRTEKEELWQLQDVEHKGHKTVSLELFPDASAPVTIHTVSTEVVDVSQQEADLRQECSQQAARLMYILRERGVNMPIAHIHASYKRRFTRAQEEMSIEELKAKSQWLSKCIVSGRLL